MNILISGGTGFIGSYLTSYLLERGYVLGLVGRNAPDWLHSKIDFYGCDVTEPQQIRLDKKYDIFIHLAAANDIVSRNPDEALRVTTLGTRTALDLCLKNDTRRFMYFSTFQVYGADSGDIDEAHEIACKNDYALTHFFAEEYVRMYQRVHALEYVIVRPTNIFGCPMHLGIKRWSLVPNCFCLDAFKHRKITLASSGKQRRDFVSLHDVSRAAELICLNFDNIAGQVFNIASGESQSIMWVASIVAKVYAQLFCQACPIEVQSAYPKKGEALTISIEKLKALGYAISSKHSMENEVEKIFALLARHNPAESHEKT